LACGFKVQGSKFKVDMPLTLLIEAVNRFPGEKPVQGKIPPDPPLKKGGTNGITASLRHS
jgi:hypothetical protein